MYQTMAIVYWDTQKYEKAGPTIHKGLAVTQAWLELKPGDPYALSFHAVFLSLKGDQTLGQKDRLVFFCEGIRIREMLAGNPAGDQFTPGRSYMQLADSYDKVGEFDKSLALREKVCAIQEAQNVDADKLYESLDYWAWTCWKACLTKIPEERKQALLVKSDELCGRALAKRPGARRTLERLGGILRELGDREYNRAKQAEVDKQPEKMKTHREASLKYAERFADVSRRLAIAPELMYSTANYARSFYAIGLMQKELGKPAAARESFEKSRHIREQLVRDYPDTPFNSQLQIDLMFSRVALGEHVEAVRTADAMQQTSKSDKTVHLYRLACVYSLSVAAVAEMRGSDPLTDADCKLQTEYRDKALDALKRWHMHGNDYFAITRAD